MLAPSSALCDKLQVIGMVSGIRIKMDDQTSGTIGVHLPRVLDILGNDPHYQQQLTRRYQQHVGRSRANNNPSVRGSAVSMPVLPQTLAQNGVHAPTLMPSFDPDGIESVRYGMFQYLSIFMVYINLKYLILLFKFLILFSENWSRENFRSKYRHSNNNNNNEKFVLHLKMQKQTQRRRSLHIAGRMSRIFRHFAVAFPPARQGTILNNHRVIGIATNTSVGLNSSLVTYLMITAD